MPKVSSWQELQIAPWRMTELHRWKWGSYMKNRLIPPITEGECWGLSGKQVVLGQQHLGNQISNRRKGWDYLGNGIRNAKSGHRCSKTETNRESVRGGQGREKTGVKKGRYVGSKKEGQKIGKGIIRYENRAALGCLLGSIVFNYLRLNQANKTTPVVLAMPHSPKPTPMVRRHRKKGVLSLASKGTPQ